MRWHGEWTGRLRIVHRTPLLLKAAEAEPPSLSVEKTQAKRDLAVALQRIQSQARKGVAPTIRPGLFSEDHRDFVGLRLSTWLGEGETVKSLLVPALRDQGWSTEKAVFQ